MDLGQVQASTILWPEKNWWGLKSKSQQQENIEKLKVGETKQEQEKSDSKIKVG